MTKTLRCLLMMVCIFLAAEGILFVHDLRKAAQRLTLAETELAGTITDLRSYIKIQADRLNDPRNSKALDAAIQTAAVFNGTGRLINKVLVPKAAATLDELTATVHQLNRLTERTDDSLNDELLPALTDTAKRLNVSIAELNRTITVIATKSGLTLDEIHSLLADPSWKSALESVAGTAHNVELSTGHIEEALQQAPDIASDLHKLSTTGSKYQKLLILARIVSLLAGAFIP